MVTVRGSINGVTFIVSRTKTSSKTGLVFMYDERDLTTQSGKETQELIFDKLGINLDILSRTMFHGQHGMNDLLEATDAKLKDELSLVIRLSVWQQAVIHCRKKGREAGKQVSEFDGKVAIRLMDLSKLQTNLDNAKFVYKSQKARLAETKDRLRNDIDTLSQIASKRLLNAGNFEEDISDERSAVQLLETERATFGESNDVALAAFRAELDVAAADLLRGERECHDREQIVNDAKVHVNVVKERVVNFQNIWKVDLLSSNSFAESRPLDSLVLPEHCPTCHQNLSVLDDHSHSVDGSRESMTLTLQNDANSLLFDMQGAQAAWDKAREVVQLVRGSHQQTIDKIAMIQTRLEEHRHNADRVFQDLEIRIKEATALEHEAWAASYVAAMASENKYQLEVQTQIQSIESTIASEESFYDRSVQTVDRVYSEWQECNECVAEMQKERTMHEQSALLMGELVDAFGPRGIQTFVLRGAVLALESSTQYYLDELSDGSQQLQLNLETGDRISRRAFVRSGSNSRSNKNENVTNNGFKERPLATLSGGQWRRCSLALTMAFAELIASKSHFCPSLVVWDEPLTHLDQTGRASVGRVFRSLLRRTTEQQQRQTATTLPSSTRPAVAGLQVSTILLILQDLAAVELEECFDCIDDVVKENGISKVYTDEE